MREAGVEGVYDAALLNATLLCRSGWEFVSIWEQRQIIERPWIPEKLRRSVSALLNLVPVPLARVVEGSYSVSILSFRDHMMAASKKPTIYCP